MIVLVLGSCNNEEPGPGLTEEEILLQARDEVVSKLTANVWEPSSIVRDGIEITGDYEGFQIEIKDGSYQSVNGRQAWPESGTWQFVDGKSDQLTRDDGVIMTVVIDGDEINISFTIDEEIFVGGRQKTVQALLTFFLRSFPAYSE